MNEIKYRVLRCATELAQVPIEEVAKIAAMLVHNAAGAKDGLPKKEGDDEKTAPSKAATQKRVDQENALVVATAKAFELLEIAYYGNRGLVNKDGYEAGLADFVEGKRIDEESLETEASLPKWECQYDKHGKKLPEPFHKGLAVLIPKPGVKASQTADARMTRFKQFLVDWLRIDPTEDERELVQKADATIGEVQRNGIPPGEFAKWLVVFPVWWKQKLSETRSAVSLKRHPDRVEKKGKQGRVKSKDDKRRRARPPVLKAHKETLGT